MANQENMSLTCNICMENKDKRTPRGLHCLHSFCQECLVKWHRNRILQGHGTETHVECPVCRARTRLPTQGIQGLPIDFNVQEIAAIAKRKTVTSLCQVCENQGKSEIAEAFCKNCSKRLCKPCAEAHKDTTLFSTHTIVLAICKLHATPLDYVCVTCSAAVCVDCMFSENHKDHTVVDAETGLEDVKAKLENMKGELLERVSSCNAEIESKIQVCLNKQCLSEEQIIEAGEQIKRAVDSIVTEAVAQHKKIHRDKIDKIFQNYRDDTEKTACVITESENLYQLEREGLLLNLGKVAGAVKESFQSVTAMRWSLPEPDCLSTDCCRLHGIKEVMEAIKRCKLVCGIEGALCRSLDSPAPVLVKEIDCNEDTELGIPCNINVTQAGEVVVCNRDKETVYTLNLDGMAKVFHQSEKINASFVSNNDIYLVNSEGTQIFKISEGVLSETHRLDPPIPFVAAMAIHDDSVYMLHDNMIQQFSLSNQSKKENILYKIGEIGSLLYTSAGSSPVLVVTDRRYQMVNVCDLEHKKYRRFGHCGKEKENGKLRRPNGITRMANGNILVADWGNSSIVEYDLEGTFVRNLLTRDQGIYYPTDIAYMYPYIWVTEHIITDGESKGSLKLFMYSV